MKIYISVDIEGVTGVTNWEETELCHREHQWASQQMTKETIAACEGAFELGVTEITIKDAHDSGRNLDIFKLPRKAKVIRGWTGSPESMMCGIDRSYDATIFIGYHSASGEDGNPLAHTMNSSKAHCIKINGQIASEFTINTLISAYYNVPVIFLSGDELICNNSKKLVPNITTVSVKKGEGDATFNVHPEEACELIKRGVKEAIENIDKYKINLPEKLILEIRFKNHQDANRARYYPNVERIDSYTVKYIAKDIQDLIRARMFIL